MADKELESMVVRLMGDGSSYQKMLLQAQTSSQQAAATIGQSAKQVEAFGNNLQSYAKTVVGALAGYGLATTLGGAMGKFEEFEKDAAKLRIAIEAGGHDADTVTAQYLKFASAIAETTTTSKGSALALLKEAELMGFSGEAAERMVQNSIALAAAKGGEAESYLRAARALEDGNVEMLRFALGLRGVKDDAKVMESAQRLLSGGMKAAKVDAETVTFQLEKLGRTFKEVTKEVGRMVVEGVKPLLPILQQLVKLFKDLTPETKALIVQITAGVLAFLALPYAMSAVTAALNVLGLQYVILTAKQIANVAIWVVSKTVMLAWSVAAGVVGAALSILSLSYTVLSTLLLTGVVAQTAWTGAVSVSNAVMAAWAFAVSAASVAAELWTIAVVEGTLAGVLWDGLLDAGIISFAAWSFGLTVAEGAVWLYNASVTAATLLLGTFTTVNGVSSIAFAAWSLVLTVSEAAVWLWNFAVGGSLVALLSWTAAVVASAASSAFWSAVALASQAATWLWNTALTAQNLLMGGVSVGTLAAAVSSGFFAVAALVAKGAVWLLNTALSVANILLGGIPIIIGVVVISVAGLAAAFLGAAAAVLALIAATAALVTGFALLNTAVGMVLIVATGVWEAGQGIVDSFTEVSSLAGPLQAIIPIFEEWWSILKDVVRVAKVDMPLAWQIMQAAAKLALEQVKSLWPPLWNLIRDGFGALWDIVTVNIEIKFKDTVDSLKIALYKIPSQIGDAFDAAIEYMKVKAKNFAHLATDDEVKEAKAKVDAAAGGGAEGEKDKLEKKLKDAKEKLSNTLLAFRYQESPEVKQARADLAALQAQIGPAEEAADKARKAAAAPDLKAIGKPVGEEIGKGVNEAATKEVKQFETTLRGSADAARRIAAYKETLAGTSSKDIAHQDKVQKSQEKQKAHDDKLAAKPKKGAPKFAIGLTDEERAALPGNEDQQAPARRIANANNQFGPNARPLQANAPAIPVVPVGGKEDAKQALLQAQMVQILAAIAVNTAKENVGIAVAALGGA